MLDATEHSYVGLLGRAKTALESSVEVAVPITEIRPYPNQPRKHFDEMALRRLGESIDAGGQTTAGIIRANPGSTQYELIDGERRWRSIGLIPSSRRPLYKARLIEADDDVVQYLISGIANFNREGHTPLEISETVCRLVGFKLPLAEIAALLGISEQWAAQMHGLRKLTPEVRAMLEPGRPQRERLPITAAIEISKIDASLQKGLAERVIKRDVTLVALRGEVIRVAKAADKAVVTRAAAPRTRWQRAREQVPAIERAVRNLMAHLKAPDVPEHIKAHRVSTDDAKNLIPRLVGLRKEIEEIEKKLSYIVEGA